MSCGVSDPRDIFAGPLNPVGAWAWSLMDAFARAGLDRVVISPGSRSTPFVLAAIRHPHLRCSSIIDERAAAFFALGWAKTRNRPVLLICTSGTAPAHYLPAVMEASLSQVPLLVLSADRPFALQDCGASQTIDQVKMFGDHVRWFSDLGDPQMSAEALRGLRRKAAQAVFVAMHPTPGPVHLNARACKPLEPCPATPAELPGANLAQRIGLEPVTHAHPPESTVTESTSRLIARMVNDSERGMIVCGPAPLSRAAEREDVLAFARASGFALLAEATSQLRFARRDGVLAFDSFDAALRAGWAKETIRPDLILQLGSMPTSAAWERWLPGQQARRVVIAPHGWSDPMSSATHLIQAPVGSTLRSLLQHVERKPPQGAWQRMIQGLEAKVWNLADSMVSCGELSEPACARLLAKQMPEGSLLGLGNSLPVRMMDTWVEGKNIDINVFSQRGVAGIDGSVAGIAGAASAFGRPAAMLLGDVTLSHDLGSLAIARQSNVPLALVVVNNGGGRIFEQLPVSQWPGLGTDVGFWTTPPAIDLEQAAAAYGVRFARVDSTASYCDALIAALGRPGCMLIEAVVSPSAAQKQNRALWAAVENGGLP